MAAHDYNLRHLAVLIVALNITPVVKVDGKEGAKMICSMVFKTVTKE